MNPVPKAMMGKKASPSRYPAPEAPNTVKALKLVAAMVPTSTKVDRPRPARKYWLGPSFRRVAGVHAQHQHGQEIADQDHGAGEHGLLSSGSPGRAAPGPSAPPKRKAAIPRSGWPLA